MVNCDNMAAGQVINTGKSKCRIVQNCLREICFVAALYELQIKAVFLEGKSNRSAFMT